MNRLLIACLLAPVMIPMICRPAAAQPGGGVYASGLLHTSMGSATLTQISERRVRCDNLGLSGQDGVEIQLNSQRPITVSVDVGPFPPGEELTFRRKGWDGTIKGSTTFSRVPGGGTNIIIDASGSGATGGRLIGYGEDGVVEFDVEFFGPVFLWNLPGGGTINPWGCPGGGMPVLKLLKDADGFEYYKWVCPGSVWDTARTRSVEIRLNGLPPGEPVIDFATLQITGSTMTSFDVLDAAMILGGHECSGTGQAHMNDHCDNPASCTLAERRLRLSNLGSSGQDGVEIDLRIDHGAAGGGSGEGGGGSGGIVFIKDKDCCYHVTLMKITDDDESLRGTPREQRLTLTSLDAAGELQQIDCDWSDYGADGYMLYLYDEAGEPVGPVGGTFITGGGATQPIWTNRCPPGQNEIWTNHGTPQNPIWEFGGCLGLPHFMTLPDGTMVGGVHSFSMKAVGMDDLTLKFIRLELARSAPAGIPVQDLYLSEFARTPAVPCPGDADGSGGVTFGDITSVLANFGRSYRVGEIGPGDADRNYTVNFGDITTVLANFGNPCD